MQYMEAIVFIYIYCTAWNQLKKSVQNICHDFQVYMQLIMIHWSYFRGSRCHLSGHAPGCVWHMSHSNYSSITVSVCRELILNCNMSPYVFDLPLNLLARKWTVSFYDSSMKEYQPKDQKKPKHTTQLFTESVSFISTSPSQWARSKSFWRM